MGSSVGQSAGNMIDELALRTANNLGSTAPGAPARARYLYYINKGVRYWDSMGSFQFNSVYETFTIGGNVFQFPFSNLSKSIDPGKDIYMYMSASQSGNIPISTSTPYPVPRIELKQYGIHGVYSTSKTNIGNMYDHYVIAGASFLFYPPLTGTTNMSIVYHQSTQPLTDDYSVFTLYPDDFDDIILDWSEAEVKRIYRLIGWEPLLARTMEQGKKLVDQYRTSTETSGGQEDRLRNMQDRKIEAQ